MNRVSTILLFNYVFIHGLQTESFLHRFTLFFHLNMGELLSFFLSLSPIGSICLFPFSPARNTADSFQLLSEQFALRYNFHFVVPNELKMQPTFKSNISWVKIEMVEKSVKNWKIPALGTPFSQCSFTHQAFAPHFTTKKRISSRQFGNHL